VRRMEDGGRRAADPWWQSADAVRLPETDASAQEFCTDVQKHDANEANFCENVIASQNKELVEVTANSGPDLELDKEAKAKSEVPNSKSEIQSSKCENGGCEPEIRSLKSEIRSSKFESGGSESESGRSKSEIPGPKAEILDSKSEIRSLEPETGKPDPKIENSRAPVAGLGDRVAGGEKQTARAKREMKRARREKAKKELERRLRKGVEKNAGEALDGELIGESVESSSKLAEVVRRPFPRSP
jgi:hypothetical protein